ncbi:hypothetical protein [Bacillus cereus group sp. Bce006]|uniref:hypothetical protein n=1 Tax=Bacillus cereus group sp. Bce006 TaxID=3445255 RepID=UPI003F29F49C
MAMTSKEKRENYLQRVADYYSVSIDEASNLVRLYSAVKKLSETLDEERLESLIDTIQEKISIKERIVPKKDLHE